MIATQWEALTAPIAGLAAAEQLTADFDRVLVSGLARLDDRQAAACTALAAAVAGSPLAAAVADAAEQVRAGTVGPEHLTALAAARAAVSGAVHDALLEQCDSALGRKRATAAPVPAAGPVPAAAVATRAWLTELAITGWQGVGDDLLAAADRTVESLLDEPSLRRSAVLVDGFAAELAACVPVSAQPWVPVRRWADLWSRAVLSTWRATESDGHGPAEPVSGRLLVLGTDIHEHGTAVQIQVHAILEQAGRPPRRVRIGVGAPKVATISGPAVWQLLGEHPRLLAALAEHRTLELTDMPAFPTGDLLWQDERATAGEPADPFTTATVALPQAVAPAAAPLDRDPVYIAEPILLEGHQVSDGVARLGEHSIPLELDRLPAAGPLTPAAVNTAKAVLGLLRWDGGHWSIRPLAVRRTTKGEVVTLHNGDWALGPVDPKAAKAQAKTGDPVAVLRERAGRLLRK
ncbi:hypothetical protein [Nocardia stercoris]|uniref:Uncharacterized protein n=1 Tax=Nocardia stercoris TaxID=2483361 RepID=A0A3M2L4J1_9NOCA|nr:hypothetical protein [Nocardia stercoris]RMI32589.1 hypothetical protein EBN03_11450 [Nocardia stercoris]